MLTLCTGALPRHPVCRAVRAAIRPGQTALVMLESPTNPRMQICDIKAICQASAWPAALRGARSGAHRSRAARCSLAHAAPRMRAACRAHALLPCFCLVVRAACPKRAGPWRAAAGS